MDPQFIMVVHILVAADDCSDHRVPVGRDAGETENSLMNTGSCEILPPNLLH